MIVTVAIVLIPKLLNKVQKKVNKYYKTFKQLISSYLFKIFKYFKICEYYHFVIIYAIIKCIISNDNSLTISKKLTGCIKNIFV